MRERESKREMEKKRERERERERACVVISYAILRSIFWYLRIVRTSVKATVHR